LRTWIQSHTPGGALRLAAYNGIQQACCEHKRVRGFGLPLHVSVAPLPLAPDALANFTLSFFLDTLPFCIDTLPVFLDPLSLFIDTLSFFLDTLSFFLDTLERCR
jgi:hypothetical protein